MYTKRILFSMFVFFVICAAVAEAAHVLLIYDSSKPHIAFAAGDIRKALAHHGHTFRVALQLQNGPILTRKTYTIQMITFEIEIKC